jgi:hypothetical protein
MPSDNLMILALRSMVAEFAFLMMIGAFWSVISLSCPGTNNLD